MVFNHLIGVRFPVGPPLNFPEKKLAKIPKLKNIITELFVVKKLPDGSRGKSVANIKKVAANEILLFLNL